MIDRITPARLQKANACYFFVRVTTLANLAHTNGKKIPSGVMDSSWRAQSSLVWPIGLCPPKAYWSQFRWCVRCAIPSTNRATSNLRAPPKLDLHLGAWYDIPQHIKYQFYHTATIFHSRNGASYIVYDSLTLNNFCNANGTSNDLPSNALPPLMQDLKRIAYGHPNIYWYELIIH